VRPLLAQALGSPSWVPYVVTFGAGTALIVVLTRARGGLGGLFFMPRDPIVQGMLWQEQGVEGTRGQRRAARTSTDETASTSDGRKGRAGARSGARAG
jgi:hypothetical protein